METCPVSAHARQHAMFRMVIARGCSPALVGIALLPALPAASSPAAQSMALSNQGGTRRTITYRRPCRRTSMSTTRSQPGTSH